MRKRYSTLYRAKTKKNLLKQKSFWILLVFLFFFAGAGYILFFSSLFRLETIEVQGEEKAAEGSILNAINQSLLSPVERKSIFLIDTKAIEGILLKAFPVLETVRVKKDFLQRALVIEVGERKGAALLCNAKEGDVCVALDSKGIAFKEGEEGDRLPLIFSSSQESFVLGERVMESSLLSFLLGFSRELEQWSFLRDQGISLSSFVLRENQQAQVQLSEGWDVYVSAGEDLSWQATKLREVLEKKIPPEKRKALEYIDVRFGDQAYVKYR